MSLPYFPMYPSDFEAKTSHLTLLEDGVYNRLLRICWMTPGCDMPADEAWVMRRARAVTAEEQEAVRVILAEFFTVEKGRYSNARLKREFITASEAHEKRKNAGSKGGKAKSLKINNSASSNARAMPKQPEPEPEPYLREPKGSLSSDDDVQAAFDAYNETAAEVGWPKAQVLNQKRKAALKARLKDAGGFSGWEAALAKARASPLCTGQNSRNWTADLDFLLQPKSFTRLMEGSYDARPNPNNISPFPGRGAEVGQRPDPALEKALRLAGIGET